MDLGRYLPRGIRVGAVAQFARARSVRLTTRLGPGKIVRPLTGFGRVVQLSSGKRGGVHVPGEDPWPSRSRVHDPGLCGVPRRFERDNACCLITHRCASLRHTHRPAGRPGHCAYDTQQLVNPVRARDADCFDMCWWLACSRPQQIQMPIRTIHNLR